MSLVFAEMKDPVREKIERYELTRTIDPAHFYPTIDEAVHAYVAETGATAGERETEQDAMSAAGHPRGVPAPGSKRQRGSPW